MARTVDYTPEALADLVGIFNHIAAQSGPERADRYLRRIEQRCRTIGEFPLLGRDREDLAAGLRVAGFERRVTIAYTVEPGGVLIQRILYAGRQGLGRAS